MNRSVQFDLFIPTPGALHAIGHTIMPVVRLAALAAVTASFPLLQAQNSFLALSKGPDRIHFGAPSTASDLGTSSPAQNHVRRSLFSIGNHFWVRPRSRTTLNPFQTAPNSSNLSVSSASLDFSDSEFALGHESSEGLSQFDGIAMAASRSTSSQLSPFSGNASPEPTDSSRNLFSAPPPTPFQLDQFSRENFTKPLIPSLDDVQFSFQDPLNPRGRRSGLGRTYSSAVLTSSDLGYGVFFSVGGPLHAGTSASLKLSF
jgi:hypothetical protein